LDPPPRSTEQGDSPFLLLFSKASKEILIYDVFVDLPIFDSVHWQQYQRMAFPSSNPSAKGGRRMHGATRRLASGGVARRSAHSQSQIVNEARGGGVDGLMVMF
jgi:hypothetical protein